MFASELQLLIGWWSGFEPRSTPVQSKKITVHIQFNTLVFFALFEFPMQESLSLGFCKVMVCYNIPSSLLFHN